MSLRTIITGSGGYLPSRILTNEDLAKIVDTSDDWIRERTGIAGRHIAADDQYTSDLGVEACKEAMEKAGIGPGDIDLVVLATATPDLTFPSTASIIQAKLGIQNGAAFDIHAVCTGFVYALSTAEKFLASGQHKRALVIGAETFSRILDWEDRSTCVLFGDGAGAVVLEARSQDEVGDRGILSSHLRCDGSLKDLLYVDGGVSTTGTAGYLRMEGNKVFREAVTRISGAMEAVADQADVAVTDIDWFVPHQANVRIIHAIAKKHDLDLDQIVTTIERQGNTSAASIPLAYNTAVEDGRIQQNQLVMIEGMGGGFTWGAALLRV